MQPSQSPRNPATILSVKKPFLRTAFILQVFEFECTLSGRVVTDDLAVAEDLVLVGN